MKEDFLHYVWKFQKFNHQNLFTTSGEPLSIVNQGFYLKTSGPDFFNAKIRIGQQLWVGNVEIHLKSSDWYLHRHEQDAKYKNVILHVVWHYDYDIFLENNATIPVLELQGRVSATLVHSYQNLLQNKTWIYCEKLISSVPEELVNTFLERLFIERAERKAMSIIELFRNQNSDWEATLFVALAKAFGLNSNAIAFEQMAQRVGFKAVIRESANLIGLEALFLGSCQLLEADYQDFYAQQLKAEFGFLKLKYQISEELAHPVEFFKLRPENFPTIRLVQLAAFYHQTPYKFEILLKATNLKQLYQLFHANVSEYWQTHYIPDKATRASPKQLSQSFIDLLVINTIIPFLFAYFNENGQTRSEFLIDLAVGVKPESNTIIKRFSDLDLKAKSAFESQALLELKQQYCEKGRCMNCSIGVHLLSKSEKSA